MPKIYIDQEVFPFNGNLDTWGELLNAIYEKLGREMKGIAKIIADGNDITPIITGQPFNKPPKEIQKIEITTRKISDIAKSGIENVKKFIPQLLKILKGAAEFLRTGETEKKDKTISGGLEGVKLMITLFINLQNLYKFDLNQLKLKDGTTAAQKFKALGEVFEILTGAQKRKDEVEIADIVEYELIPLIESFTDIFNQIKKIVKQHENIN